MKRIEKKRKETKRALDEEFIRRPSLLGVHEYS